MKIYSAIILGGLALCCTGCGMLREVNASTSSIRRNRMAVESSTYSIEQNRVAVERSTQAIERNIEALNKVTENIENIE